MPINREELPTLINRRSFVLRASLWATGSALFPSLIGCSNVDITIPCLGAASAPNPVPGMTYIRASQIGCALDCDLTTGRNKHTGGAATDDGPRINAAMAAATEANPMTLIIDGSALISGLFMPAGGHWSIAGLGCGTGFFVKSGTNNDGIHNGPSDAAIPFNPGPPAPARGMSVSLSNFTLNGNQYGDSTTGLKQGTPATWYCGINLMNLDNITIENVVVVNTPSFHFRLSNVGNVSVTGCVMKSIGLSTDGLHFDGPANDITISDCEFNTGDDAIALNCPEGYTGDIRRVAVNNCKFYSLSLMRIFTTIGDYLKFYVDGVTVSNCRGTFSEAAFLIGLAAGSNLNSINLTVSDSQVTAPSILALAENFGTITLTNVTFIPLTVSPVIWNPPPQTNHHCAFVRPSPLYGGIASFGTNLSFSNCSIHSTSNIKVACMILDFGSTIRNVQFDGFAFQNGGSNASVPDLILLPSGSIGALTFASLNSHDIQQPVPSNEFASVGSVAGAGVLATGWEFPDAVMADNVPYISASTGLPSIKVDGAVEPFPQP